MFASRWPRSLTFSGHWVTNSEIVRASSTRAEGPYRFEEVVLPWRHRGYFDALSTHNPAIKRYDGRYYLFYVGMTYDFDIPTPERQIHEGKYAEHKELYRRAWGAKRIGLAVADSVMGPWRRPAAPLLEPRPGRWDALITSNPSVAIRDDGHTVLIYKSTSGWDQPFHLGIATAPHPAGPYTRVSDEPIFPYDCEDPFIWWEAGRYHVIMKDFTGVLAGQPNAGAYAWSEDGLRWHLPEDARAYSRTVRWTDGTETTHGNFERPSLLIQDGRPTHLFAAISSGPLPHWQSESTRNVCIPLRGENAPG
ncbi:MAG TPA: glycoside hydrolase family protein [Rariglobus sp.]